MARYAYIRVSTDKQSYDQQVQDIKAYGIDLDTLDGITEEDRAFNSLLKKCKSGDIIYAASTDRIGCDFFDMMKLMKEAAKDGIEIIACKQNLSIARDDVATRIIVAITAIMDEAQDAKMRRMEESKGVQWVRAQIAKGKSRTLILEEFNEMHALDPENYSTREGKPLSKGVLSKWCREMNPPAVKYQLSIYENQDTCRNKRTVRPHFELSHAAWQIWRGTQGGRYL